MKGASESFVMEPSIIENAM